MYRIVVRANRIMVRAASMPKTKPGAANLAPADDAPDRAGVQVIARAALVLRALRRYPEGASLGELAQAVELPRSTVQRIVDALDTEGLVVAASSHAGVRLGPALLGLAAATRFGIVELARPIVEALAKATGETVDLSIANHDKVVFVDQLPGIHRLAAVSAVGVSFPMHSCANGKAVLALMDELELRRVRLRLKCVAKTQNTHKSWHALNADLDRIRKSGIAYDREENSRGISAVAMAFRMPDGQLGALSIPVPTQRFRSALPGLLEALMHQHQRLTRMLRR
jgi:IclR family transcriptional regulator, acetate operon repressor